MTMTNVTHAKNKQISLTIDDTPIPVDAGTTIMEAAEQLGIRIPRLCYHPDLSLAGSCRVCVVDVKGMGYYMAACSSQVWEGMEVQTNSPEIRQARRDIVELLLDNHNMDCQTCERDGHCELQNLAYSMGVRARHFEGRRKRFPLELSSHSVVRDSEKCVLCGRCVRVCAEIQGVYNLSQHGRGFETVVTPAHGANMDDSVCIQCGQCINVCPTAAFLEKRGAGAGLGRHANPEMHVVVQTAPSIRAAIGEGFGLPPGTPATGQMITALRRLGFDRVFDTDFGADLTIIEEAHEFLTRLEAAGGEGERRRCRESGRGKPDPSPNLPIPHPSSPFPAPAHDHLLLAGLDQLHGEVLSRVDPARLDLPLADVDALGAGQDLLRREERASTRRRSSWWPSCRAWRRSTRPGGPNISVGRRRCPYTDAVLTTRELIWMIKCYGIDFKPLPAGRVRRPAGPGQRRRRHFRHAPAA